MIKLNTDILNYTKYSVGLICEIHHPMSCYVRSFETTEEVTVYKETEEKYIKSRAINQATNSHLDYYKNWKVISVKKVW